MSYQQPFRWHYPAYDDTNFQIRGRTLFFILVLFAVILLVGLIVLYARWICRVRHTSTMGNETTSSAASLAAHAPVPTPRGLDAAAINSLPIELHACLSRAAAADDDECCICLSAFADGDKVKVLPLCRHRFHCECVDKWLTTQSSCPLCRDSIGIESAV